MPALPQGYAGGRPRGRGDDPKVILYAPRGQEVIPRRFKRKKNLWRKEVQKLSRRDGRNSYLDEFNPTSEVQNIGNRHFKTPRFETPRLQTDVLQQWLQLPLGKDYEKF